MVRCFRLEGREICAVHNAYIVGRPASRQENFAVQQNRPGSGRAGGGPVAGFPPPAASARPASARCRAAAGRAPPSSARDRACRRAATRAASPRKRPRSALPRWRRAARRSRCRPLPASRPSSADSAAPSASAATGSPGSSRPSTSSASRCGRSASKRRISRSKTRSRGRSSGSASSGAARTVSSIRREKAHRIAGFDGKCAVERQDRQTGLGRDRRHRQPPPSVLRDRAQRGVDQTVSVAADRLRSVDPGESLGHRARLSSPVRASARSRRRRRGRAVPASPGSAISTSSAARVVPPGLVTFSRSRAGVSDETSASSPAPATVARARRSDSSGGSPARDTGGGQRLDQQKDIGRAAARHGRDRIHQRLVLDPGAVADRGQQPLAQSALLGATCAIRAGDRDRAPDRGRRVRHAADDRRLVAEMAGDAGDRFSRRDRQKQRFRTDPAAIRGQAVRRMTCGLTAKTTASGARSAGTSSGARDAIRPPGRRPARCGMPAGSMTTNRLGRIAAQPAAQHRRPHLAAADEHDRAGFRSASRSVIAYTRR